MVYRYMVTREGGIVGLWWWVWTVASTGQGGEGGREERRSRPPARAQHISVSLEISHCWKKIEFLWPGISQWKQDFPWQRSPSVNFFFHLFACKTYVTLFKILKIWKPLMQKWKTGSQKTVLLHLKISSDWIYFLKHDISSPSEVAMDLCS